MTKHTENAWYCDICGGFFTLEDSGSVNENFQSCEECHELGYDTSDGEILH